MLNKIVNNVFRNPGGPMNTTRLMICFLPKKKPTGTIYQTYAPGLLVGYSTLHLSDYWYCSADENDVEITISVPFPPLKSQRPSVPLLKSLEYFQQWS